MNSYLSLVLAQERHRDLIAAADRHRLAAVAASPAALRRKAAGLRRLFGPFRPHPPRTSSIGPLVGRGGEACKPS